MLNHGTLPKPLSRGSKGRSRERLTSLLWSENDAYFPLATAIHVSVEAHHADWMALACLDDQQLSVGVFKDLC
jgi:hypothetical protein